MIIVHGRRNSSNVQRVLWALAELGVTYDRRTVGGSFGGGGAPEYQAMNPTGMVPTLQDGDLTIWESEAILRYLAASYGAGSLWPEAPRDRALADQWLAWTASTLVPAFSKVFHNTVRLPRAEQDFAALAPDIAKLNAVMTFLDAGLRRGPDYLGGAAFSYGDIPAAILVYRYLGLEIERPDLPSLMAWWEQIKARPACQAHVMLPFGTCHEEWAAHERALHAAS